MDAAQTYEVVVKSTFFHVSVEEDAFAGSSGRRRRASSQPPQTAPDMWPAGAGPVYVSDGTGITWRRAATAPVALTGTYCSPLEDLYENDVGSSESCSSRSDGGREGQPRSPLCCPGMPSTPSTTCSEGSTMLEAHKSATSQTLPLLQSFDEQESWTTVMMRNLPHGITRTDLLALLLLEGFAGKFDFLYVPTDFRTKHSTGFAFVNLVSPADALAFRTHFMRFKRWGVPSNKVCNVSWANADQQGLQANIERYRNSSVMHRSVPEECKPILLVGGMQVPFPKSTKKIWPPSSSHGARAQRGGM